MLNLTVMPFLPPNRHNDSKDITETKTEVTSQIQKGTLDTKDTIAKKEHQTPTKKENQ